MKTDSGIALIAVMAALMVLSAIALGLATSVSTEARIEASDFQALQAEQLARSGQEIALFLEARGLKRTPDFLAGLPMEAVTPGFHYRAQLTAGTVDVFFEADNGKLDLNSSSTEVLTNFFALWTGNYANGQLITAAIEDWRDADGDVRPNGAEAAYYAPLNYAPRNTPLGIADVPLIRGLSFGDFQLKGTLDGGRSTLRNGLDAFITSAGGGAPINANFAPELVLRSIPGLTEAQLSAILARRIDRPFEDVADLQTGTGLSADAPALRYLTVARSSSAVSSIAHLRSGNLTRSERRVIFMYAGYNILTGGLETKGALGRIERNTVSDSFGP
jgi:type II secretory pathway component PulK